jgi:serine-type D-Ala-D-Ala carboxypeptidase (penicillin-binding protein 5/6)
MPTLSGRFARVACWLVCLLFAGTGPCGSATTENPFPDIASAYLVKRDGAVLWQQSAEQRLPPASLTKLMTALLILERGELTRIVSVHPLAAAATGSQVGLRADEQLSVSDLLAATLIASANDACRALAIDYSGDEAGFVAQMNRRVVELGLKNTQFVNACGHDAPGQYASASDLATIAEAALRHRVFSEMVSTRSLRISVRNPARQIELNTSNALLGRYPGASGVKTGFTAKAGKCLLARAERDGQEVLLVLLNAPDRWWSAHDVLERAFAIGADAQ